MKWKKRVGKLIDPGSAAGLDGSIAKAAERGENHGLVTIGTKHQLLENINYKLLIWVNGVLEEIIGTTV